MKVILGIVIGFAITLWVIEHYPIVISFFHDLTNGIL